MSVNVCNNKAFKMQSARWDTNTRAAGAGINKLPVSVWRNVRSWILGKVKNRKKWSWIHVQNGINTEI